MDLKKVFDQTVREIKREVNKKVLKAPEIEQKVLEATSNEQWGPHGTLMADIAQATRNYNEYQMIMAILWKRLNDSGKNWRHVYKALTVLEYLVANGAERVIDELREHAYQLQTLVDFQYVESSSGKDQGLNVRRKAQTLVGLINDTEKIREVRSKAAANREKYRGMSSTGGIYRASSYSSTGGSYGGDRYDHDDDRVGGGSRYGSRDDDRYGGGKDRDNERYRDDDRYSRDGDRYGRDNDRYRDNEYGNDRDRDNDVLRRNDRVDGYTNRDRGYDDDDRYSTRSGGKVEDDVHDERRSERTNDRSKGNSPPSYEEVLAGNGSPYKRHDEASGIANAVARATTKVTNQAKGPVSTGQPVTSKSAVATSLTVSKPTEEFDDFDPRGSSATSAAFPVTVEQGFLGETAPQQPPPTVPKSASGIEDLFGEQSFVAASAPTFTTVANPESSANQFQPSTFSASTSGTPNIFTASATDDFSKTLTLATPDSGLSLFSAPPSIHSVTHINSSAFTSPPLNNPSGPSSSFDSFPPAPLNNSNQPGPALFGNSPFTAFGAPTTAVSGNNLAPAPASTAIQPPTVMLPVSDPAISQSQLSIGDRMTKPQPAKDKFEPKSSVWADHLSSGLLDLNIARPKNNPLAELGIHLDSSSATRRREVTVAPPTKGKAMGSGTGMGIVGASILTPPPAPAVMGGGIGARPGFGMGMPPPGMTPGMGMGMGMGYGMNPGSGMAPPIGMNPGAAPGVGFSSNPGMMPGAGPGSMGMGMGMNPSFGPSYQQQQYGGFR